jgi:hypothetical protein
MAGRNPAWLFNFGETVSPAANRPTRQPPFASEAFCPSISCQQVGKPEGWFAVDSPLEGDGFEPQVPRQEGLCNTEIAADREPGVQIGGNSSRFSQRQRQRKPPSGDLPLRRPRGTLFIATGHYSAVGTKPVAERAIAMSQ